MRDYIYIEDVDGLQDNILDEDCKIIYLKQHYPQTFPHREKPCRKKVFHIMHRFFHRAQTQFYTGAER